MSTSLNPADITVVRPIAANIALHDPDRGANDDDDYNDMGTWDSHPWGEHDDRD
ncbi:MULTISPECIES: hypothetical protein [Kitasatospora]|uniref:hypothetical protein n=1 Tax=Kitasatospora TaxID=2063 RepID=UPI0015F341FB|nr:hypothetical protein [Kitasatospora xanthocidica]